MAEDTSVRILEEEVLKNEWSLFRKVDYEFRRADGGWQRQSRELCDRGDGVTILLYNRARKTVLLVRQFRIAAYLNGLPDGMLLEACGGIVEDGDPEASARREVEEETGYRVGHPVRVAEAYSSPGSMTEKFFYYVAEYLPEQRVSAGGGHAHEGEDIHLVELPFTRALEMISTGELRDARAILLLQYAQMHRLLE